MRNKVVFFIELVFFCRGWVVKKNIFKKGKINGLQVHGGHEIVACMAARQFARLASDCWSRFFSLDYKCLVVRN